MWFWILLLLLCETKGSQLPQKASTVLKEVVDLFNKIFGWPILITTGISVTRILIALTTTAYYFKQQVRKDDPLNSNREIASMLYAAYNFTLTSILMLMCSEVVGESQKTKHLCFKMQESFSEGSTERRELFEMAVLMKDNEASFTAAKFFAVDRSTIVAILGTTTTPRIVSQNGHLTFMAADHKNISFQTQGNGRVHVNGIDLTQAAETTQNAINAMAKYETNFDSVFEKMSRFEQLYQGLPNTVPQQGSADNSSYTSRRTLRDLNRRVTSLSKQVRRMGALLATDECVSNPCKNGGTCQDQFNSFYCHCPAEWEGPLCDKDVNECARFAGTDLGCQNGATCVNRKGSYDCLCPHGYFGLHCIRRSADCSTGSGELCGHGTCVPQNNDVGYKCLCDEGWTTDGNTPACRIDVNECNMNRPPCSINPHVECVNTPGSFVCAHCPAGYSGNGYYCTDIDECQSLNGGCSVNPMVQCINTLGSRLCGACPPGYMGDGVTCNYQGGACSVNNGGCHPLATCRDNNRIGSSYVQCTCPLGFVGNGLGYNGCTRSLITIDACSSNPCVHGSCVANSSVDYICVCPFRYSGRNCEVFRDLCSSNPCLNGGTCTTVMGLILRCTCANGFTGSRCEQEKQACGGKFTQENGTIAYPSGTFTTYNHRVSCAWIIETNVTKVLNITFTKFDLETGSRCQFDWLEIHDGRDTMATSFGRFCGKTLPNGGNIVSTHNTVYFWFRSDSTVVSSGFELSWTSVNPVCGELSVVSSHGTIQSPGSPGNYPNNRDCYWLLIATTGKRLLFHFFTLMIGNDSDCNHDYLEFISGVETDDPIFAKYCNTTRPAPLFSVGSEVLVHFHSDSSITYPGFQVTYSEVEGIPGCGGVFTQDHGQIRSPSYNGHYPPDMLCEYKIQLPAKSRIKLTFLSFSVEDSDECKFDSVSIRAGANVDAPLIGRYCGNTIPPSYVSEDNNLLIVFKTDWATDNEGFVLEYELLCGGQFRESSGIIESPGYPKHYPSSANCVYEIIQPLGTAIELRILVLDIEANSFPQCSFDYLEVRDGDNENSTLIGRYCRKPPPFILSSFNILYLKFVTDTSVAIGKGFQANYTTIKTGCGGILKEPGGTITSPNHPTAYQSNLHCLWVISAPPGNVVQLIWLSFRLESGHKCAHDYVEIFDNNTETGRGGSMGRFCGNKNPPIVISTSNIISLVFHTDHSITSDGFLATYSFVDERTACGGNYYTSTGYIRTPNYPETYPLNIECSWTINVEPGHQIMLNVTDFELESASNCKYDYLEIRNGASTSSPLLGKYCGKDIPKLIPSHTNKLHLYFKSDLTKSSKGFKIFWDGTSTGCGGSLTAPSGSIISPHYPEPYNSNAECMWKISVSAGSLIQLIFADLELEVAMNCTLDYVQIFDGPTINSNSLGRFCVNSAPPLKSSSNHVVVKFRSDISQSGRGFQLQYSTACNNTLRGFGGVIESPNFPSPYFGNLNCNWDIEVSGQNKINITFSHFQLERINYFYNDTEKTCAYDFVEVQYKKKDETLDSESRPFEKFATYCGDEKPPLIHINSDVARVRFVTDNLVNGNGFRLEWVIDGCGGILTHPNGSIQSPNYPRAYPPSIECNWKIQVEFGNSIEITFGKVNIEKDSFCNYDSITIYNGEDETFLPIAKFCRQDKPVTVTSTGNFMYVKFQADSSYQGTGFYANYSTKPTKCGGKYVHDKGSIMSPNYPLNYDMHDTCGYEIEVTDGHLIALQFSDVDLLLPRNVSCSLNNVSYIKVYDGPTAAYPVLTKICGKDTPNTTFMSTYNHMYVEMVDNSDFPWKGFLANYHKACGARIETSSTGFIKRDPHDTDDNDNCTWTIVANDPTKHVSLTISQFSSFYTFCEDTTDFPHTPPLIVYNGETADAPILGQYCESKLPPMLTTDGSAMHIVSSSYVLLFATYSVYDSACGGTLLGNDGYFSSPGYPKNYPMNTECEWNIKIPEGNSVALTFSYFQLLTPDNSCNTDYLEIRRNSSNGKLLGVFCGDNIPTNITNEGSLWIFLKTSSVEGDLSDITAKGFYGEYNLMHDNELFGPSGVIVSPINLDQYSISGDYSWRITVDFGKRVLITFKEMSIDQISEGLCSSSISVYGGPDATGQNLGSFCGTNLPEPIKTTSNEAFILANFYVSTRNENQFKLEWLQVDTSLVNDRLLPITSRGNCSYDSIDMSLRKNSTYITSPGYPNGYSNDLNCEWIITTIPMNHLELSFTDLDLDSTFYSPLCYLDYVELFKRTDTSNDWESINTFCRYNQTDKLIIGTNLMKVVFKSNGNQNGTGFKAQIFEDCGGSLTDPSGFITFDKTLKNKAMRQFRFFKTCQWNVTVRSGKTIKVEIIKLKIAAAQNGACGSYLMLRNGQFPDSPLLGNGKYCGDQNSIILQTTANHLYVKYSGAVATGEFTIKYQEQSYDCGGDIALSQFENSAEFSSPHYPNVPQPHIECTWIILAPPAETIRIDFVDRFDLTSLKDCPKEYVEVRDGGTVLSRSLGTFCSSAPNSLFTSDNLMFVKFFTDVDDPGNGFKAKVSIEKCGGTLRVTRVTGVVTSPFFNQLDKYPVDFNCTWHLKGPPDLNMEIKFNKIDLPDAQNCTGVDFVEISEVDQEGILPETSKTSLLTSPVSYKFCGKNLPKPFTTSGSEALVHFQSGKEKQRFAGFSLTFVSTIERCGGVLEVSNAIFTSSGYPRPLHGFRTCTWSIKVPDGRRVKLEFIDLDIDAGTLYRAGITIYQEQYQGIIGMIRSNNASKVYYSSGNTMFVRFWSHSNNRRGFKAAVSSNEPSLCQANLEAFEGSISQPIPLQRSYYCSYGLTSNSFSIAFTVTFATNNSELVGRSSNCRYTYVGSIRIKGGTSNDNKDLYTICSPKKDVVLRSPYRFHRIITMQHTSRTSINYTIDYKTYPCGGIISSESGVISSPNYPNRSSSNLECSWLLKLPEEQSISLTFTGLNLGSDCEKSFLDIYNGPTPDSPMLGKYCQNNMPSVSITSQTNSLWIEYSFNDDSDGVGFSLKYDPVIQGCGGVFHDRSRVIQTPLYPKEYPNNAECLWELQSERGYRLGLHFTSRVQLEQSDNCQNDFLEIWDWQDEEWVSLGRKCGREIPQFVNSTSNRMKILFRSNDKITGAGFRAQWEWNCGGTFTAHEKIGYIVSPGYPKAYKPNINCQYIITSSRSDYIVISFLEFKLEGRPPSCRYDNVSIENGYSRYSPKSVYCGSVLPPDVRLAAQVSITFRTDSMTQAPGFLFSYQIDKCGGNVNASGVIRSPSLNNKKSSSYMGYTVCVWNITAPPHKQVVLQFEHFNLPMRTGCYYDNVEIYEGLNARAENLLANLCGDLEANPPHLRSTGNSLSVKLKADRSSNVSGFEVTIFFADGPESGCGGSLNITTETELSSPNLNDMDCTWTVYSPPDTFVNIHFIGINLPGSCGSKNHTLTGCKCGSLEIKDGASSLSDNIEKLCGVISVPRDIVTSTRTSYIRLVTRGVNRNAFRIQLTPLPSACGPYLLNVTNTIQTLQSPNYPSTYPPNMRCTWRLKGSGKFVVHFEDFDLLEDDNLLSVPACDWDKFEIVDDAERLIIDEGLGNRVVLMGQRKNYTDFNRYNTINGVHQFCGRSNKPFDYYTQKEQIVITFSSGEFGQTRGRGFKLQYQLAGCSRNYSSISGRVVSTDTNNCYSTISVPENRTISVFFLHFVMYNFGTDCADMGIEIRDGKDSSGKLLLKACGYNLPNPIFSSTNNLWLHSWGNHTYTGSYDLTYTSTDQGKGCGGPLYNYKGRFSSPLYPLTYKSDQECRWSVRVPVGMRVAINFIDFDIQGTCDSNYVKVATYSATDGETFHTVFCKGDNPAPIYSETSGLEVTYHSSYQNEGTGWLIAFEAVNK